MFLYLPGGKIWSSLGVEKERMTKYEKKKKSNDNTIFVVLSAPIDVVSDVMDGSSDHISDGFFVWLQ